LKTVVQKERILHQILQKSLGFLTCLYRIYNTYFKKTKKILQRGILIFFPYSFKGESWHNFWQLLDNRWWGLCRRLWRWNMGRNKGNMKSLCLVWFFITRF